MTAHGAYALVLEIDVCRRAESLFQTVGANQRRGAIVFIHVSYGFGDMDPRIHLIHLLTCQFFGKDGEQVFCAQRLLSCRVEGRKRLVNHISLDVVPLGRDFLLSQEESFLLAHNCSLIFKYVYNKILTF